MRFLPKIVFFDIDDTLFIKNEQRIPASAHRALAALRERGIITAIATGRTPAVLPECVQDLIAANGIELLVAINGQYVRHQGKTLAHFPMSAAQIGAVSGSLDALDISYAVTSERQISVLRRNSLLDRAVADLQLPVMEVAEHPQDQAVYQVLAFYPPERENELRQMLPENIKTVRWHDCGVDLLEQEGSKARGIQAALSALGLEMADAMAFGDGMNDLEMLQSVGFGVAMGNAVPELQALADYVCPAAADDGIWQALTDLGVIG